MYPYVGWLATYPIFFVLGFLVGAIVAAHCAHSNGVDIRRFALVVTVAALAMLIGGKVHSLLERGSPASPISWELVYGYRYAGGLLAFVATLWVASRVSSLKVRFFSLADAFTPALGFAIAVIRVGCFLSGCCFGKVCDLPWAVQFPTGSRAWHAHIQAGLIPSDATLSVSVHPLQLYLAVYGLMMGVVLLWVHRRKTYDGQVFLLYLLLHGLGKFALESFRHDHVLFLQLSSLGMAVVGGAALLFNQLNDKSGRSGSHESAAAMISRGSS